MAATLTDLFIILLLLGAIGYGWYVSRKVQVLMGALKEMEPLVKEFSSAVDKTEDSVNQLKLNLEEPSMPAVEVDEEDEPMFSTRRQPAHKIPGARVVRNKQDLVRRFFETSRSESRA
ncbi:MAG: flagellar motor switch protein [Pseudomonadota bacterium]|nr:flagellar motor switch protein [Pseudomonadota bacterium]